MGACGPRLAMLEGDGVREGLDYRHVPVLAAAKRVAGIDWYVIAKTDVAEALTPEQREQARALLGALGAQIEARAEHPEVSGRLVLLKDDRTWTYKQYRDECVRYAHFLLGRLGKIDETRPGHVAVDAAGEWARLDPVLRAVRAAVEAGILVKGGGHAMAAGLTVEMEKLGALRSFLEESLAPQVEAAADRGLAIDAALTAGGANLDLIELLDQAGPYGAGNPAPVFALPAHRIVYADRAGNDHIRCTLAADDGSRIKAVAFRALGTELGEFLMSERKLPAHIAGRLTVDDWNGARAASLHIVDAAAVS